MTRRAVLVGEQQILENLVYYNPHKAIAVAKEKYFPALIGYIINKNYTQERKRLLYVKVLFHSPYNNE